MNVQLRTGIAELFFSPLAMAEALPPSMTYRQLLTEKPSVIAARDRSENPRLWSASVARLSSVTTSPTSLSLTS